MPTSRPAKHDLEEAVLAHRNALEALDGALMFQRMCSAELTDVARRAVAHARNQEAWARARWLEQLRSAAQRIADEQEA